MVAQKEAADKPTAKRQDAPAAPDAVVAPIIATENMPPPPPTPPPPPQPTRSRSFPLGSGVQDGSDRFVALGIVVDEAHILLCECNRTKLGDRYVDVIPHTEAKSFCKDEQIGVVIRHSADRFHIDDIKHIPSNYKTRECANLEPCPFQQKCDCWFWHSNDAFELKHCRRSFEDDFSVFQFRARDKNVKTTTDIHKDDGSYSVCFPSNQLSLTGWRIFIKNLANEASRTGAVVMTGRILLLKSQSRPGLLLDLPSRGASETALYAFLDNDVIDVSGNLSKLKVGDRVRFHSIDFQYQDNGVIVYYRHAVNLELLPRAPSSLQVHRGVESLTAPAASVPPSMDEALPCRPGEQTTPGLHDAGIEYGVLAADIAADNMAAHIAAEANAPGAPASGTAVRSESFSTSSSSSQSSDALKRLEKAKQDIAPELLKRLEKAIQDIEAGNFEIAQQTVEGILPLFNSQRWRSLSCDELIEWFASESDFKTFKNDSEKKKFLDHLRKDDVNGEKLLLQFDNFDKTYLQARSYRLSEIVTNLLNGCGFGIVMRKELIKRHKVVDSQRTFRVGSITYDVDRSLGEGKSAEVFHGEWEAMDGEPKEAAIKKITKIDSDGRSQNQIIQNEFKALSQLTNCPNVVYYYDHHEWITSEGSVIVFIAMEKCDFNLRKCIADNFSELAGTDTMLGRLKNLILPICEGLKALHTFEGHNFPHGILHRDIKPENILVKKRPDGSFVVKLCDMGFALRASTNDNDLTSEMGKSSVGRDGGVGFGTKSYMDADVLEVLARISADATAKQDPIRFAKKSDVFSLGCVMYEILTTQSRGEPPACGGRHPFEPRESDIQSAKVESRAMVASRVDSRMADIKLNILKGKSTVSRSDIFGEGRSTFLADSLFELICCPDEDRSSMLHHDKDKRPSVEEVVSRIEQHPAMSTGQMRWSLVDDILKDCGAALRPIIAEMSEKLLCVVQKEVGGATCCKGSSVHEEIRKAHELPHWQKGTNRLCYPSKAVGKEGKYSWEIIAQRDYKKRLEAMKREKRLPYEDVGYEETLKLLHEYDKQHECICGIVAKKLQSFHKGGGPAYSNCNMLQWLSNGWELMKAFTESLGHMTCKCHTPDNMDTTTLLNLFKFCTFIKDECASERSISKEEYDAAFVSADCLADKVKSIRNGIGHSVVQDYDLEDFESDVNSILALLECHVVKYLCPQDALDATVKRIRKKSYLTGAAGASSSAATVEGIDDSTNAFAPEDTESFIRAEPPRCATPPPSPGPRGSSSGAATSGAPPPTSEWKAESGSVRDQADPAELMTDAVGTPASPERSPATMATNVRKLLLARGPCIPGTDFKKRFRDYHGFELDLGSGRLLDVLRLCANQGVCVLEMRPMPNGPNLLFVHAIGTAGEEPRAPPPQLDEIPRPPPPQPDRRAVQGQIPSQAPAPAPQPPLWVNGTVIKWNSDQGWGFIQPDVMMPEDGGRDVYCHCTHINDGDALNMGSRVRFVRVWNANKGNMEARQVTGGYYGGYGGGKGGYGERASV